jgi:hypothetical protein
MLQIKDTIISEDIIEKKFCCDLDRCKGACCVKGDAGAPLTKDEVEILPVIIGKISPYLRSEGLEAISMLGTHVIDDEDEAVTPLVNGEECAYVVFEKGIAKCGIENAYNAGVVQFRKPLSCHLYPIRIKNFDKFLAVNYDKWEICEPARVKGNDQDVPVYKFVKEALFRRFGEDWYHHLSIAGRQPEKNQ